MDKLIAGILIGAAVAATLAVVSDWLGCNVLSCVGLGGEDSVEPNGEQDAYISDASPEAGLKAIEAGRR